MAQLAAFWAKLTMLVSTMRFSDIVDILIVAYLIYNIIMAHPQDEFVPPCTRYSADPDCALALGRAEADDVQPPSAKDGRARTHRARDHLPAGAAPSARAHGQQNVPELPGQSRSKRWVWITSSRRRSPRARSCHRPRPGALIVFERGVTLDEQMRSGTTVNSDVTAELLKNIFYPKAPLHDGAVVIRDGRIAAVGCVLPLTSNTNLSPDLGTRHRAASA